MAVIQVGVTTGGNKRDFIGLSTDTKPTADGSGVPFGSGSTFLELDTSKNFIFDGTSTWHEKTQGAVSVSFPDPFYTSVKEFEISVEITRPANATAYAANQIINGNGASTLPTLDFTGLGSVGNRKIQIISVTILSSNGGASTKLNAVVNLFNANTITGQTLTDATTFNPSYAELKAKRVSTFEGVYNVISHGSNAFLVTQTEVMRNATLDATGKLYAAIIASNAYTPASGETLTLTVKGYLL